MPETDRADPPGAAWPQGVGRRWLDCVDSTNLEALRRLRAGEHAPFWLAARRQTAGRGRRGRAWGARDGDLTASLALRPARLRPDAGPAETATLSFVAALAVHDAVRAFAPAASIALKWPNDVLVADRKIAGVLLESDAAGLVIGVGLNLAARTDWDHLEAGAAAPTTLAEIVENPPAPADALARLAFAMAAWLDRWAVDGFAAVRAPWLARAARLGQPIQARLADRTLSGRFVDVDASGALVLETSEGERRVAAADLFFPAAGPAEPPEPAGPAPASPAATPE